MGPHPSSPVPSPRTPTRKSSTPPRVLVGVSPICVQHTPPRTLVSRGCSPIPMLDLLPPDIAAFFNSTQMQLSTQASDLSVPSPIQVGVLDVISLTSSESDSEGPFLGSRIRARSPTLVPETQVAGGFVMDVLVRPHLCIYTLLTQVFRWPQRGERWPSRSGESCIRPRVDV